jgi:hypothetical protein
MSLIFVIEYNIFGFSSDTIFILYYAISHVNMHTKFPMNPSMFRACRANTNLLGFPGGHFEFPILVKLHP